MDKKEWEALRYRAQTDLFWLSHKVLGYPDVIERVHQPVCDVFVHKDPAKSLAQQDECKQRLILDPRGHFKTTLDVSDAVQWVINFPDIRGLLLTGTQELVERMVGECKYHFSKNEVMRKLFPELCVPPGAELGTQLEFTVPGRKKLWLREPTITGSTLDSVKTGSHYDFIKYDDTVHENNVGTPEQIDKTIHRFHMTTPLMDNPETYRDVIGTRYDFSDLYGWIIDHNQKMIQDRGAASWKVFVRKVWTHQPKDFSDLSVKLLFPERFKMAWLLEQQISDPYIFSCQYLNDPRPGVNKTFDDDLILRHTLPLTQLPIEGRTFITWDLGFTKEKYSDYSVGAVGRYDWMGRIFVLDVIRGRYSPFELIEAILKAVIRWRPARMAFEKASGSDLIMPGLLMMARDRRIQLPPIDWIPTSPYVKKVARIAALHPLMIENMLWFASSIECREDLRKEFTRFPKYSHNDIPDAISMLLTYRGAVDIAQPDDRVEMVSAPVYGDGSLGAGLIG